MCRTLWRATLAADPSADPGCEGSAIMMTGNERDQFFEAFCRLREAYSHRVDDDRVGTVSIEEVVGWAEREMVALERAEATTTVQASEPKA
jgi:hypothetical protein